jgi:hypothetical protein
VPYIKGYSQQKAYIIYGKPYYESPYLDLTNLTYGVGTVVSNGGMMVTGIGDVNRDGYGDVMITNYPNWMMSRSGSYLTPYPARRSLIPTVSPTFRPSTIAPTPTKQPSSSPTVAASTAYPTLYDPFHNLTAYPTATSVPSIAKTKRPTLCPSSLMPSVRPSLLPTVSPSILPSHTKLPSFKPSVIPSLRPSRSPTIHVTTVPSKKPSLSPSVPLISTVISSPGEYIGNNGNQVFNISLSSSFSSPPVNQTIRITGGNTGMKTYLLYPISSLTLIITDFSVDNIRKDVLDFSHFPAGLEVSYTSPPLTLFLPHNQKVILVSLSSYSLILDETLILPEKGFTHSSSSDSTLREVGWQFFDFRVISVISSVIGSFALVIFCTNCSLFKKKKNNVKTRGDWKTREFDDHLPLVVSRSTSAPNQVVPPKQQKALTKTKLKSEVFRSSFSSSESGKQKSNSSLSSSLSSKENKRRNSKSGSSDSDEDDDSSLYSFDEEISFNSL